MKYIKHFSVALLSVSIVAFASNVQAETIRATSGFGPKHDVARIVYPAISKKLSELTNGKWDLRDTPSGLLKPKEMNKGLKDGITELAPVILAYTPSKFPETLIVGELSMSGVDHRAIASAVTEYVVTCTPCLAEFKANGQVYLGSESTLTSVFLAISDISSLDDFKGKRVRVVSPLFSRYISSLGGEAVQMPSGEIFEALNQGVIDAAFSAATNMRSGGLIDVIKNVTTIDRGVFAAVAPANVGLGLWARMDLAEREALVKAIQWGSSVGLFATFETDAEVRAEAKAKGIKFSPPGQGLVDATKAFYSSHLASVAAELEKRGIKDAQAKIDRYLAILEKWEGLIKDTGTPEKLAELRWTEIWSKVNLSTFGQ